MMIPVTIAGHLTAIGMPGRISGFEAGPWRIHTGGTGETLHELWGYHDDAVRWIAEHGLTDASGLLVNP